MGSKRVICLLLAVINCVSCNSNVPVLIWNAQQPADANVPAVSALQQLSVASLQARYLDAFKPDNVLLFIQDALSIEDLSSHGSELEHVNAWMEAGHSLYVPNVMQPSQLQHDLVQQGYKVTSLAAGSAIAELKLDAGERNLVVVKLPPTITNPSRSRALRKTDEVMQSVISKVGGLADFTVIYTGLKPSVEASNDQSGSLASDAPHLRVARSLQQFAVSPPSGFHNRSCIWIYVRKNMTFSLNGDAGPFGIIPEHIVTETPMGNCDNSTHQTIQLNYDSVTVGDVTLHKLKLGFLFTRERTFWRSPRVEVRITRESGDREEVHMLQLMKWVDDSVPIGKSYACSVPLIYKEIANVTNPVELVINGVQVEAFRKAGATQFGPSWDCVGFFTIGIWAGLLSTLISILILSFGFTMLANIKTMDRFDDPKGKTIMVPQTAD